MSVCVCVVRNMLITTVRLTFLQLSGNNESDVSRTFYLLLDRK